MIVGPLFTREWTTLPRRGRLFFARATYGGASAVLIITAWQVLAGSQVVRNVGDFAHFGTTIFQLLAPLHLSAAVFFAALSTAAAVAQEKDRRTFDLLLLTNLSNSELVLGKLLGSLLAVANLVIAAVPFLALTALMGGIEFSKIIAVFWITVGAMIVAGSLGSTIALWRDKTFQTLATTTLVIIAWTGFWEAVARGALGNDCRGISCDTWAAVASPWHAILVVVRPFTVDDSTVGIASRFVPYSSWSLTVVVSLMLSGLLNLWAIWRVRVWNPSREVMIASSTPGPVLEAEAKSRNSAARPEGIEHRWSLSAARTSNSAAEQRPDASSPVAGRGLRKSRAVWDNPILWREIRTWAYGRKVLPVRAAYVGLIVAGMWGLSAAAKESTTSFVQLATLVVPAAIVGALLINMQAVTAVTSERDVRAIDLLLVTDLTPKEFVFGKLGGIFYNTKEMLAAPLVMALALWWFGVTDGESAGYLAFGWLAVAGFAAVVGLHIGMHYSNSRNAAAVSLATVFFLIVGTAVSMRIMTAFSGSFQAQLQPFLATIVGGGIGLYVALGRRNPSPAITLASFALPLATFYAMTSFLLDALLATFLAVVGAYCFASAALLVPAIFEFDVAAGRTTSVDEKEA
ncbi:MAG: ABC transporter permease subunit [Planctomycetia bacterium]|nr:ABC transporter permease subunit [Planctomycetia bacterium]